MEKVRNADGYVVYRADKKKGKYKKVKVLNGARKISFTNKKLKKKKTYYYKVCAYRKVGKKESLWQLFCGEEQKSKINEYKKNRNYV